MAHGIFCLEGEWFGNMKRPTTVEPALQLLRTIHTIPYIHRNVATVGELDHYIKQWQLQKHSDFPILYLGFHGDSGCLCVGDQRHPGGRLGLDWFEARVSAAASRILYFGSCLTLDIHGTRVKNFLKNTGLSGIIGYKTEVDWLSSTLVDISVLSNLALRKALTPLAVSKAGSETCARLKPLADELGLKFAARP
jgi:hypothetical protein